MIEDLAREIDRAIRRGDLDTAEEKLKRLRALAPVAVETRGLELSLLLRRGRLEEAARLADQVVEQFAASARIWYLAGLAQAHGQAVSPLTPATGTDVDSDNDTWYHAATVGAELVW